ncbi:MAG: endonuclease domain-containing protein [Methylobacterium sp.]|uniref:endonuclease domain-containing protein n=1 Tax=Methylobacterium sp. TaxID=409 RepID=UPI002715D99B|nr:endonuclease domain-containing protein [Methylobacterium sp.]MDO9425668.1 endonuclease domain-containing protein [Methylobacterium sp.]
MTPQEVKLWVKLRELKPLGFHFRRQAPIRHLIVDFASFRDRLVIEVDGGQHGMEPGAKRDVARDAFLHGEGFRILRFWNSDVDQNLDGVMHVVWSALRQPPPDRPFGRPPSPRGRRGGGIEPPTGTTFSRTASRCR